MEKTNKTDQIVDLFETAMDALDELKAERAITEIVRQNHPATHPAIKRHEDDEAFIKEKIADSLRNLFRAVQGF